MSRTSQQRRRARVRTFLEMGAALAERSNANLLSFPETFNNAYWEKAQASISADATTAPNGTATADKLVEDTSDNTHEVYVSAGTVLAAGTYTFSIYIKAAGRSIVRVLLTEAGQLYGAFFDLSAVNTLSTNEVTASISSVGNGWLRCAVTRVAAAATHFGAVRLALTGPDDAYVGDGASGVYLWGAKLEAAAAASAYP